MPIKYQRLDALGIDYLKLLGNWPVETWYRYSIGTIAVQEDSGSNNQLLLVVLSLHRFIVAGKAEARPNFDIRF